MSLVHPLSKVLRSINGCQRQYLRSYIRYFKQQRIAFWDIHWNISKETTFSNGIHDISIAGMISAVDFDSSLQSSLDEFLEEAFDKL